MNKLERLMETYKDKCKYSSDPFFAFTLPAILDALEAAVEGLKEVSKRFDGLSPEAKIAKATLTKIESLLGEQGKEAPDEQG